MLALLERLNASGYGFVTPTPDTHQRVFARAAQAASGDLRDIFGWSRPFDPRTIDGDLLVILRSTGMVERADNGLRSLVRVSSLAGRLFLHSAFPTDSHDSVFLGPDSYRFASFLERELAQTGRFRRLVDIGAGAGVGAIAAAPHLPGAQLTLLDLNPLALRLARINAAFAGIEIETVQGSAIGDVTGEFDLAIANPPFIIDQSGPVYRDGGDLHGARLSLDWTLAAAERIDPGGLILLYTGSAIVAGRDQLREALEDALPKLGCTCRYGEIDPDIFGEQLDQPGYEEVERIAAIGAVIRKSD